MSAPGCDIDGWTDTVVADGDDLWGLWFPPTSLMDCTDPDVDFLQFSLECVDAEYVLTFTINRTIPPFTSTCTASAVTCNCLDVGPGNPFQLVFDLTCVWCCSGTTLQITVDEIP